MHELLTIYIVMLSVIDTLFVQERGESMKEVKMFKKSCLTLIAMLVMLFAMSITASAETVGVTGLTQTDATKTGATVSWNPSASAYLVYVNGQLVSQQAETSYTVGLVTGGAAEVVVIGYNEPLEADAATIYNNAAQGAYGYGIVTYACAVPGKPGNVANADYVDTFDWRPNVDNDVKIGWTCNKNDQYYADGWEAAISTVDGKKKIKTLKVSGVRSTTINTTFSNKAIKNKGFSVKVRGYIQLDNGKKYYGAWSSKKVVIPQAKTSVKKKTNSSVTVKWGKIAKATKYEVYVCKDVNVSNPKFKKVATVKGTSYVIKNIKTYQKYGVYIKAVTKYGKKTYKSSIAGYHSFQFTY